MAHPNLQLEIGKKRPFEVVEEEVYLNLVRTTSVLAADFEKVFKEHGLSEATYNALRILRGAGVGAGARGRMTHEIGDELVARVPDITRLVDRLEQAGLAARARCDRDRRVVYVHITDKGLALLASLDEPLKELHKRQLAHMSRDELRTLNELLFKARHAPAAENTGKAVT